MKKRYTEEQIIGFLREADAGLPVKELCRKHGFSEASYYGWKARFGGMSVSDAQRPHHSGRRRTPRANCSTEAAVQQPRAIRQVRLA
jgi:hypothetical protein